MGPVGNVHDLRARLRQLPAADAAVAAAALDRERRLTKPEGALGRLEGLSTWLAAWQGREPARLDHVQALVFAGNHGVVRRGVSAYPAEVTAQMVANFETGGAAINQLCGLASAELSVIALDLDWPTADLCKAPAMSGDECLDALNRGIAALGEGVDLLCVGEMGIGNTTAAAALAAGLFGGPGARWAGPGTGLDGEGVRRKAAVIDRAMERHGEARGDPFELLRRLGGREIAALAGAILAARENRVPVLLDGFVTGAAAAVLHALSDDALAHTRAAHLSAEPGHRLLLERLGLKPLLELGMRLGEGSGAALAALLCRAALACHTGMATFEEAAVSGRTVRPEP
jgi:nicotinate-nucleotide--dimethylbenzimidazole phosphoribosyltransferase